VKPTPLFVCSVCCDDRSLPAEELRVESDGRAWCFDCWDLVHDGEWSDLPAFVPPYATAVAFLDEARAARCEVMFLPKTCISSEYPNPCWPCRASKRAADAGLGEVTP